ncbi:hypothetical protein CUJ86_11615 [Methanofollis fontis]|uniref:Glycosyl hydrolase family 32 N-terminal domain-containing protein n=1 Tax=Methanofollis fontis TaxID=2052832 RepID=A0A483CWM6_9EURY|nr:hypothetical protein CUJ86_11615 [Methanofollis fontis]
MISRPHGGILENAQEPLAIQTYDGSDQVVHPSVIDFLSEHTLPEWGGHRFWMAITPFPSGSDAFENPCLYASDDGRDWHAPPAIQNPIDAAPGGWDGGFHNDPEMVYDPESDEVRVYYRFASKGCLSLKLIRIGPDLRIRGPDAVVSHSPWTPADNTFRSPCIWRESADRWHMWGGGGEDPPGIYHRFSEDGVCWGPPERCTDPEGGDPFGVLGYANWHMACKPNYRESRVEFLSYARSLVSPGKGAILYAECDMGAPNRIRTPIAGPVLLPSKRGWDDSNLYRCSFCISDTGAGYFYRIWYSGASRGNVWKLGYTGGYLGTARRSKSVHAD